MKNKKLDLKSINLKTLPLKLARRYSRHAAFGGIIIVLLVYILVVFKINHLANAEPNPNQPVSNPLSIPSIDQQTINHIQSLEDNNPAIKSLLDQALNNPSRNNPFQE